MALLPAVVSGRGTSGIPTEDCAMRERSTARTRPTQSSFSSSRASRAIASGGALGSSSFGAEGAEDEARAQDKVRAGARDYPQEGGDRVVGEVCTEVLDQGVVNREVRSQCDYRYRVGERPAHEEVDPAGVPHVAPGEGVVEEEVAQDAGAYGDYPGHR